MLLLASGSPRRVELLALGGWSFRVAPAEVDERVLPGENPRDYVLRLAAAKARSVADQAPPGWLVLGADTAVVDGTQILGKPGNPAEAAEMLRQLRGRQHEVYTALALLRGSDGRLLSDVCVTEVPMRPYLDQEIEAYIATGDPLDKAGAYAIQHAGFRPVHGLQGCYANVVGLPLCHLVRTLSKWGLAPHKDVPEACQSGLDYHCPIHSAVLRGEL